MIAASDTSGALLPIPRPRQGKRWHQTLKNRLLLEKYYLPGDLEVQIHAFVDHCNCHRHQEASAI
jgi:hypothetical protein